MIGRTLAHYRIGASIGSGGMGEVYRATDTHLHREVAVKVLPPEVTQDPERLARFRREAQLLASLNHPNVAAIYGLEEADGQPFLTLELVEGEDLRQRLDRGPIPLDEALEIALQIAAGLEEAHEKGVVHRDLKPANVKLTPEGKVKILDFGLAKAYAVEAASGSAPDLSQSPTLAHTGTAAGLILGTAAYMSPEQARGKPVDKRADIWAFGVLLWEMLAGRTLFAGETVSDILAAVLTREPDWALLPGGASRVRDVLARCLEKDPRRRLRDIGDVGLELQAVRAGGPVARSVEKVPPSRGRLVGLGLALLAAAVVGGLLTRVLAPVGPRADRTVRLSIPFAPTQRLNTAENVLLAFSPDGSSLVVPVIEDGQKWLVKRRLDGTSTERIEGTEGGTGPFFSPDGRWLGFFAGGKLMKVAAEGGRPFALTEQQGAGGGSWAPDGRIVFAPIYSDGLFRVSSEGGDPERLTTPDRARGELGHWWPQVLPGGRTALFTAFCSPVDTSRVGLVSLETGEVRDLVEGGYFGRYVPSGHLLYVKGSRLFAAPFDVARGVVTGPAKSVLDDLFASPTEGLTLLDVSRDGTLAWVPGSVADPPREVVSVDRDGRTRLVLAEAHRYRGVSLSADGHFLATAILDASLDVWTYSLERGILSRLTTGPRTEFDPFWSRDGKAVYYVVDRPPFEIHRMAFGSTAEDEPLWTAEVDTVLTAISADGRRIVYTVTPLETGSDLWVASLDGDPDAWTFRATPYTESYGTFSPDGHWLAYASDETGRPEVYVEAFPGPGDRHQISADGGEEPLWTRKSGEIFYRHGNEMRAVRTRTSPRFEFEEARTLFSLPIYLSGTNDRNYDVTPDGQRVFTLRVPDAVAPRRIDVVTHWRDELSRLVACVIPAIYATVTHRREPEHIESIMVAAAIGNAAEHSTAVLVAMKDKMDLALGIAMGSSMQIALFVAPVLVIAGHSIGRPLGLEFTILEVAAVMLSVLAVGQLVQDGRTNWFEDFQLLAVYAILAVAFYFV
jgi:Tol biopolymer transport system component